MSRVAAESVWDYPRPPRVEPSAEHVAVHLAGIVMPEAAWSYPHPAPGYEELAGYVAFYPGRVDACVVDGERVAAQAGDFYGGWITARLPGPFKGGPGTAGW